MVGKFQIAASFAVIYVYAGELMPTVVRSQVGPPPHSVLTGTVSRYFRLYFFFIKRLYLGPI